MVHLRRAICVCVLVGLVAGDPRDVLAQWPQFRGPNGSGVGSGVGYPVDFSPSRNVVWKTAVPYGQSSPVVAGGRVYLTASDGDRLLTIALDSSSGREVWRRELRRTHQHKVFHANDPASPTAAADDDGVVVFFADFGLAAYTRDGKERWTIPLGPFKSFYGMSASPVIDGDLVVMLCDQRTGSFLLAIDRTTGRQRWRQERALAPEGWATPMIFRPPAGPAQVVVLGSTRFDGYAVATGEPLWWMPLGSGGSMGTAVAANDTLYVSTMGSNEPMLPTFDSFLDKYDTNKDRRLSNAELLADKGWGEHFGWIDIDSDGAITDTEWNTTRALGLGEFGAIAVRPGSARGRLEPSAVVWRLQKNLPYIPALLLYQNVLYLVKDGGIITTVDPATGKLIKEGRSPRAPGDYFASPVAAEDKVFVANTDGQISVLKASGAWDVLGVNDMGEEVHATPALSDGRIYVRTRSALYCFGKAGTQAAQAVGLRNFAVVDSRLYRGGQPEDAGFAQLRNLGVDIVVNLRHEPDAIARERTLVEAQGMRYVSIPWRGKQDPKTEQMAQFLELLRDNPDRKVFVHCERGAERTGVMVASYRMSHDRWTADQALAEMETFGFRGLSFGHLKRFVREFAKEQHSLWLRSPPI